jgi:error-prone DNA polymerase
MGARLMAVHGFVQKDPDSNVIHVVAGRLEDHTGLLSRLSDDSLLPNSLEKPDSAGSWGRPPNRHPRNVEIIPKSRDFH